MENSKDKEIAKYDNHLGNDEFVEILTWMPAKQVTKFYSLSKTIFTLLSKPSFVRTQCIRSSVIDGGVFVQYGMHKNYFKFDKLEFHTLLESSVGIPNESLSFIVGMGRILASSEGLLLLHTLGFDKTVKKIFICNPATRRCVPLPIPEWLRSRKCNYHGGRPALECHPRNLNTCKDLNYNYGADYTIILPVWKLDNSGFELAVYSNGKWEEGMCNLSIEGRLLRTDMPLCLFRGWKGGLVVHYLNLRRRMPVSQRVKKEPYIVAYDVGRKAFSRNFKLPEGAWEDGEYQLHHDLKLFKWRSSSSSHETIGLVRSHWKDNKYIFMVWVLEDYESGSWRRVIQKTTVEMGLTEEDIISSYILSMNAMGMGLVFMTGTRVYVYQLDGPHSGRLEVVAEHGFGMNDSSLMPYTNTLRPVCASETQLVTRFDQFIN